MARQTYLNTPEDCQWVRDTHLSPKWADQPIPAFGAAIIHGNEDCPDRIELYLSDAPRTGDRATVFVYNLDTGRYNRSERA